MHSCSNELSSKISKPKMSRIPTNAVAGCLEVRMPLVLEMSHENNLSYTVFANESLATVLCFEFKFTSYEEVRPFTEIKRLTSFSGKRGHPNSFAAASASS